MNNFNFVAPFYDTLVRLVFGRTIERATFTHLDLIKENSKVLVLGGGTGNFLHKLPQCKSVLFIDSSDKMINRAKSRKGASQTKFLVADAVKVELSMTFDVVICPFFLDCFDETTLATLIDKIEKCLTTSGKLVVIDFQGRDSALLVKAMHLFFRLFANLESKRLLNINDFILKKQFSVESEEFFHKNLIFSRVYGNL